MITKRLSSASRLGHFADGFEKMLAAIQVRTDRLITNQAGSARERDSGSVRTEAEAKPKGYVAQLFQETGLLDRFIDQHWPTVERPDAQES